MRVVDAPLQNNARSLSFRVSGGSIYARATKEKSERERERESVKKARG